MHPNAPDLSCVRRGVRTRDVRTAVRTRRWTSTAYRCVPPCVPL